MTDKALEAALLPCPLCNSQMAQEQWYDWEVSPLPTLHVTHTKSACPLANVQFENTADNIAAWNRRAPLSALPGEAEVVGLVERLRREADLILRERDGWKEVTPRSAMFVEAADALQAMQARAEAAERERDEALGVLEGVDGLGQKMVHDLKARVKELEEEVWAAERARDRYLGIIEAGEKLAAHGINARGASVDVAIRFLKEKNAAEARVKELEEALELAKDTIKVWHGPNAWEIYDRASPEMSAINTALKGGSNG